MKFEFFLFNAIMGIAMSSFMFLLGWISNSPDLFDAGKVLLIVTFSLGIFQEIVFWIITRKKTERRPKNKK